MTALDQNFIVQIKTANYEWFLKGTTWTSSRLRADVFNTRLDACSALKAARRYTRPDTYKAARIMPASESF